MKRICYGIFVLAAMFGAVAGGQAPSPQTVAMTPPPAAAPAHGSDPGERAFKANCSRCHTAPEQLSPRIAGTVLMHMRVRANLSAADEKALLHFLAP
jgi:cytochrome c5